jgi:hypothetical protein
MNRYLADLVRRGAGIHGATEQSRVAPAPALPAETDPSAEGLMEELGEEARSEPRPRDRRQAMASLTPPTAHQPQSEAASAAPEPSRPQILPPPRLPDDRREGSLEVRRLAWESLPRVAAAHRRGEARPARPTVAEPVQPTRPAPPASLRPPSGGVDGSVERDEVGERGQGVVKVRHVHLHEAPVRTAFPPPGQPNLVDRAGTGAARPPQSRLDPRAADAELEVAAPARTAAGPSTQPDAVSLQAVRTIESLVGRLDVLVERFENQQRSEPAQPLSLVATPPPRPAPGGFADVALQRRHSDRRWY